MYVYNFGGTFKLISLIFPLVYFVDLGINVNTVNIISRLLAECIGTAILMLFGCASGLGWKTQPADFVGALGFGLVVMIIVQTFGEISGAHVNPVVSLCALLHKTLSIWVILDFERIRFKEKDGNN